MANETSAFGAVRFDQVELPDTIYKYRSWANPEHRRILTHTEIHFSKPLDLSSNTELVFKRNDEGITDHDLFDYYYRKFKEYSKLSEEQCIQAAKEWANNSPLRNADFVKSQNEIFKERLNFMFGIFSVSKHKNIERMWRDFGNNDFGFCVGFDSKKLMAPDLILSSGGHVTYYARQDAPVFKPFYDEPLQSVADMLNILYNLPKEFAQEDEYRLVRRIMFNQEITVPPDAFKEIILGQRMAERDKEEIKKLAGERFKSCKVLDQE